MTAEAKKIDSKQVVSPEQQITPKNTGITEQLSRNYRLEICPAARVLLFVYPAVVSMRNG
jgi:hypothetical protein